MPTPIAGTADRDVAATYRRGTFAYRVPLAQGRYRVRLTFVEPSAAPGERVFDVVANGQVLFPAVDIAARAGAAKTALVQSAEVGVVGDGLTLQFRPQRGEAVVAAVEIESVDR